MQEAQYYTSKKNDVVKCWLCPRNCYVQPGEVGFCNVRKNIDGKLYAMNYGKAAGGLSVDPIEKKPLFHFLPGTGVLSFGTVGCNLRCKHCQNWTTAQAEPGQPYEKDFSPKKIVDVANEKGCKTIAYTYNEPTIFFEYMLETAKLARKEGLKNVIVSNGFINPEPLRELAKYIDAANIDLKGFNNSFYGKTTTAWVQPVLESLKILQQEEVWLEVTNLIIPTLNDDPEHITSMCEWILENLGSDVPLHFSRFHPDYKLRHLPATPITTLMNAYDIAKSKGLNHVYIGNMFTREHENTVCPNCKEILVERTGFNLMRNNVVDKKCKFCKTEISGIWSDVSS